MSILANCPDCKKNFRVPHAETVWHCKACGGELEWVQSPECPECGEDLAPKAAFCENCGHALSGEGWRAEEAEAKVAAAHMRKTRKQLRSMNLPMMLWMSMFYSLLLLLISVLMAADLSATEPAPQGWMWAGFAAAYCLANAVAIAKVKTNPFALVLILAAMRTLMAALELFSEESSLTSLVGNAAYAVALWFLVANVAKLERLARENPDLYQSRLQRGEISRKGVDASHSISRRGKSQSRARSKKTGLRLAGIFGGLAALAATGFFGFQFVSAAPGPEPTLEQFQAAWNRADVPAVAGFFGAERKAKWTSNIEKVQIKYGWGDKLPPLSGFEITARGENRIAVRFLGEGGAVGTKFRLEDGRWRASSLKLKEVKHWQP